MTLAELMARYEERARLAQLQQSTAPVATVYRVVLDELAKCDGIESAGRWITSGEAAEILGVSAKTVRKWCIAGRLPSARKTSGEKGDWRIPAHEVYEDARPSSETVTTVLKLWRPDE